MPHGPDGLPRLSPARVARFVAGGYEVTVNPIDGSEIVAHRPLLAPTTTASAGRPAKRSAEERAALAEDARPPVPPGPALPELPLLERAGARRRLLDLLGRGRSALLTGAAGSGRTTLLDSLEPDCADLLPDGVVRLDGRDRRTGSGELLQALHAVVHDAPRERPDRAELTARLRDVRAVVLVDDVSLGPVGRAALLRGAPRSVFVLAVDPAGADADAPSDTEPEAEGAEADAEPTVGLTAELPALTEEDLAGARSGRFGRFGGAAAGAKEPVAPAENEAESEEPAEVHLAGLSRTAHAELVRAALGRELTEAEAEWAESLRTAGAGLPLEAVRAAALLRSRGPVPDADDDADADAPDGDRDGDDDESAAALPTPEEWAEAAPELLARSLSPAARAALRMACALEGAVPHHAHLPALLDEDDAEEAVAELVAAGLATACGPGRRLSAGVLARCGADLTAEESAADAESAARHYTWWSGRSTVPPERVADEAEALLAALSGAGAAVSLRLARTAAPAFAAALRWDVWERALRAGAEAARGAGADAELAYFHHELGVFALCENRLEQARTELEAAIALRGALADKSGTVAGRRALALVADRELRTGVGRFATPPSLVKTPAAGTGPGARPVGRPPVTEAITQEVPVVDGPTTSGTGSSAFPKLLPPVPTAATPPHAWAGGAEIDGDSETRPVPTMLAASGSRLAPPALLAESGVAGPTVPGHVGYRPAPPPRRKRSRTRAALVATSGVLGVVIAGTALGIALAGIPGGEAEGKPKVRQSSGAPSHDQGDEGDSTSSNDSSGADSSGTSGEGGTRPTKGAVGGDSTGSTAGTSTGSSGRPADPSTSTPPSPGPSTDPDPGKPDPEKPDPEKPDPGKPDPEKPDPEKPDPGKPDPEKPDPEKPDPGKPDPEKPDPGNPDPEKPPVVNPGAPVTA
ncbi:hypothetical protein ACN20G_06435 [Streptomyces sp. BI20]|uniref:hypothetical protein n=1 Tax=Streptomyces sp. BI20 TaxID=3403460 RepID=UPI003C782D4B